MKCKVCNTKMILYDSEYLGDILLPSWWCNGCLEFVRSDVYAIMHIAMNTSTYNIVSSIREHGQEYVIHKVLEEDYI